MKPSALPNNSQIMAATPPSSWRLFVATFCRNRGAVLGLLVLTLMVIVAILAPSIAPHDPYELYTGKEQLPPAFFSGGDAQFFLGTDDAGRDTLSRVMYGARYSLFIGLSATTLAMITGISLGLSAAFWPKVWGKAVMLVNDILMSYPSLLLAIIIAAILGPNMTNTIITIALVCTPPFIRLTRATAMVELQREYFTASKVMGAGVLRLLFITILPNCMAPLIVQATMIFSSAILEAGAIGFLGFGVQPPDAEWGAMLGTARQYIQSNVWLAIWPGLAIFLAALSINLTGDGLRDALDPKLKQVS
ncbi:ABC transporter permease [Psychrobacter sp. FDAARGOS_221]|uniref:ABC transporter permease n=1 Tax=Psychrobacter sp. FDAARGOS_221 TaxID=1975705 RepID=UPI000BB56106|nr:ABC transporter permease subunit [Psychrobacter sp. FDAARGOS_221]PNK59837.1 dipeptide ABC transporter permease DppC [Psychrobacter sp. FDAARGOS_221]